MSNSLQPHGLQHGRLPCPSPTPGVCSNSCPLSRWCHPTSSSSVVPFSWLQSFPASGSFPMSQFLASGGQSIGASASASVLPMNIQDWFPLGFTSLIFALYYTELKWYIIGYIVVNLHFNSLKKNSLQAVWPKGHLEEVFVSALVFLLCSGLWWMTFCFRALFTGSLLLMYLLHVLASRKVSKHWLTNLTGKFSLLPMWSKVYMGQLVSACRVL